MDYLITGLLVIGVIILYLWYGKNYSKRLIQIGLCAAQTYVLYGDEAALLAARTVAASMAAMHKIQLIAYIQLIPVSAEGIDEVAAGQRRFNVVEKITFDENGVAASVSLKSNLKSVSEEWLRSVMKCDYKLADKLFKQSLLNHISQNIKN
jgi:hypothetical protein